MKLVYIAGPYRAPNHWEIEQNIHRARCVGASVAELGGVPLIPHANTAHWDGLCPDEYWLEAGIEMLRRCDAVALVPGWHRSEGTLAEIAEADRLQMPIFPPFAPANGRPPPSSAAVLSRWLGGALGDDEARAACVALGR